MSAACLGRVKYSNQGYVAWAGDIFHRYGAAAGYMSGWCCVYNDARPHVGGVYNQLEWTNIVRA